MGKSTWEQASDVFTEHNQQRSNESHIDYRYRKEQYVQNRAGYVSKAEPIARFTSEQIRIHEEKVEEIIQRRQDEEVVEREQIEAKKELEQKQQIEDLNTFLDAFDNGEFISQETFQKAIPQIVNIKNKLKQLSQLESAVKPDMLKSQIDKIRKQQAGIRNFLEVRIGVELHQKLGKFQAAIAEEKVYKGVLGKLGIGGAFPKTISQYAKISRSVPQAFLNAINSTSSKIAAAKSQQVTRGVSSDFTTPRKERSKGAKTGLGQNNSRNTRGVLRPISI